MEANKLFFLLGKHWSKCILALLVVASIVFWTQRSVKSSRQSKENDYTTLHHMFTRFQKGEFFETESLTSAEHILERHPELRSQYDPLLTLIFFAQHNVAQAIEHGRNTLERAANQLSQFYRDYAYTSLLIAQEKYLEAWDEALALDEKIENLADYMMLDGMNRLRLFFLADRLHYSSYKKTYWEKLIQHPAFPAINAVFQEGEFTLARFL
jgi:hypothetical protein